jgi:hypothetical protein
MVDLAQIGIDVAWHDALKWAQRGNFAYLSKLLRSDTPLRDDTNLRNFLADVLDGKFKRGRGTPPKRPRHIPIIDLEKGVLIKLDERDLPQHLLREWVRENRKKYGHDIYHEAAKVFDMTPEEAEYLAGRSKEQRKRKRAAST